MTKGRYDRECSVRVLRFAPTITRVCLATLNRRTAMPYFALFYDLVADYPARRGAIAETIDADRTCD